MKKVIDADNMKILEHFEESDTDKILKRYENMGFWQCVSVDRAGDIILWEE
jgi:hypothetical protein